MVSNFFKIAFRHLRRNGAFSWINIMGLSFGMACSIAIFLYIQDERSFDQFHEKDTRIYRVMENERSESIITSEFLPWKLATVLSKEIPEIEKAVNISWNQLSLFTHAEKSGKESGIYASPDLFAIFSFPLISGSSSALKQPDAILVSDRMATKYFPGENALGKTIRIDNKKDYLIAGVLKDIPANSTLQFDYILPAIVFEQANPWIFKWGSNSFRTYVLLHPAASPLLADKKIKDLLKKQSPDNVNDELFLQKYSEAYLHGNFSDGRSNGGRVEYLQLFAGIALLILIMACINYANLATATSVRRTKEVGIRKVLGGDKKSLVLRFLGEAVLLSFLSVLLAVLMVWLLLPVFNEVTGKAIKLPILDLSFYRFAIMLSFGTGLAAGCYPAFFLASFSPARILQGTFKTALPGILLRKSMIVFQFGISIALIFATIVMKSQAAFITNKQLGIARHNIVQLTVEDGMMSDINAIKSELLLKEGIVAVTTATSSPIDIQGFSPDASWPGKPINSVVNFSSLGIDYDFLSTMHVELAAGRNFSRDFGTDSNAYIINETAAKTIGNRYPLNSELSFWNGKGRIIGVIKDFHFSSLHNPISPMILMLNRNKPSVWLVDLQKDKVTAGLESIQKVSKAFNPASPFEYTFLDNTFDKMYRNDELEGKLVSVFALITIIISCIGLIGLSAFIAQMRLKEISIRKLLGASVHGIVLLLSKNFLELLLIAELIFLPVSNWAVSQWLNGFAYRIPVGPSFYVISILLSLVLIILSVGWQAANAARKKPVIGLKEQ